MPCKPHTLTKVTMTSLQLGKLWNAHLPGNPLGEDGYPMIPVDDVEVYPLVLPEDRGLITDYLYLAMEQMQPCSLVSL